MLLSISPCRHSTAENEGRRNGSQSWLGGKFKGWQPESLTQAEWQKVEVYIVNCERKEWMLG